MNAIDRLTEKEAIFLDQNETCKNEHGVYIFTSQCKNQHIDLRMFLYEYKMWMEENGLIKVL